MRLRRDVVISVLVAVALIVGAVFYNSLQHRAGVRALVTTHECRDYFVIFGKVPERMLDLVEVPPVTNPDFTVEKKAAFTERYGDGSIEFECTVDKRNLVCTAWTTRFPRVTKTSTWSLKELEEERNTLFGPKDVE